MIRFEARLQRPGFLLDAAFTAEVGVTALFGPSGSGKSSIIRLIAGLERPDSGEIALEDKTLMRLPGGIFLPPHRRRIGLVFQDSQLFPHLSVRGNLAYGRFFTPKAERRIGLDAVVDVLGIRPLLDRRPATLSGGERQRVSMGRAMLTSPRLLLMDEPLASLDQALKQDILPFIERLRDEFAIPILYVSHATDEVARLARKVVRLEAGKVAAMGPPEAVLAADFGGESGPAVVSLLSAASSVYNASYDISRIAHVAGDILVPGRVGAGPVRLSIAAQQVALVKGDPGRNSVRTVLRATVSTIERRSDAYALVRLTLSGGAPLAALVTRLAVDDLALAPGDSVLALVKSVAIDRATISKG
jgi:molybdate transport system ATP-binding protein